MPTPTEILGMDPKRFQPDPSHTYGNAPGYRVSQKTLAAWVGVTAFGLPIAMYLGALLGRTCFYNTISHFYFAQFWGDVFVVALAFMGTFLLAYRGESPKESWLAGITGVFAYAIALFPTEKAGCELEEYSGRALADFTTHPKTGLREIAATNFDQFFELFSLSTNIHGVATAVVFAFLAYYSFFIFTREIEAKHRDKKGNLLPVKRRRNLIYRISGSIIVLCIVAIFFSSFPNNPPEWWTDNNVTFWLETMALWAFGTSWVVKGRAFGYALNDEDEE